MIEGSSIAAHDGWRIVSRFPSHETLIIHSSDTGFRHHTWVALNPSVELRGSLSLRDEPQNVAPVFNEKHGELIYASSSGIIGFSFLSGQERLIVPIDSDTFEIKAFWLSPEGAPTLLYILGEREEPWSKTLARALESKSSVRQEMTYTLHSLQTPHSDPRLLARFPDSPSSVAIDWHNERLFALLGYKSWKPLVRINLKNNRITLVREVEKCSVLSVSSRHNVVVWGGQNPMKGVEMFPSGRERLITIPGLFPAVSDNGKRLAFTVGDYEIWLADMRAKDSHRIISLPNHLSRYRCDTPTWCPCGNHFAVFLTHPKPGKSAQQVLAIVDCKMKKVIVEEGFSAVRAERLWVPTSTIETYFSERTSDGSVSGGRKEEK